MRHPRFHASLAATLLVAAAGAAAFAQPGQKNTPAPSKQAPAPAPDARATKTLEAAVAAVGKLSSLAFTATVAGPQNAKSVVLLKKADAGGWKIYAKTGDDDAAKLAAYDGLSVRAVDHQNKIVWEQSTEKLRAIRGVFARQAVDHGVIWELLGDEDWASAAASSQPGATVDGVACDVIALTAKIDRVHLPPAAPGKPAEAARPAEVAKPGEKGAPPARPDSSTLQEVRLFLGKADHLPRRIIRRGESGPVTIDITAIETDKAIPDSYFNVDTPSGYTVKAANPSPTPKPDGARTDRRRPDPEPGAPATFGLPIGSDAPAFTLKDADGRDRSLADYKGRVVVLDFWGSWCPPCRAAMPGIQKLHEHYMDQPVSVLGLNFEQSPKADPAKFMKDKGFTYGLLLKAETIASQYKISGWPTFYILDREGRIAWSAIGHDPQHEAQMMKVIDDLLKK